MCIRMYVMYVYTYVCNVCVYIYMYKDNEFTSGKKTIRYSQMKCSAILLSVLVCTLACLHLNICACVYSGLSPSE